MLGFNLTSCARHLDLAITAGNRLLKREEESRHTFTLKDHRLILGCPQFLPQHHWVKITYFLANNHWQEGIFLAILL